jgi:hypothetical protein
MLNSFFVLVAVLREGSSGILFTSDSGVKDSEYPDPLGHAQAIRPL